MYIEITKLFSGCSNQSWIYHSGSRYNNFPSIDRICYNLPKTKAICICISWLFFKVCITTPFYCFGTTGKSTKLYQFWRLKSTSLHVASYKFRTTQKMKKFARTCLTNWIFFLGTYLNWTLLNQLASRKILHFTVFNFNI